MSKRGLDVVARELATANRQADPSTSTILLFPAPDGDEIRLLEVSTAAPTTGEVLPVRFAEAPQYGVEYRCAIILVSDKEYEQIEAGQLKLPDDWNLDEGQAI